MEKKNIFIIKKKNQKNTKKNPWKKNLLSGKISQEFFFSVSFENIRFEKILPPIYLFILLNFS